MYFNKRKAILIEYYIKDLADIFYKLDTLTDRIELQDVDGFNIGTGIGSNKDEVEQRIEKDKKMTTEERWNTIRPQLEKDLEYFKDLIKKNGGTDYDIEEARAIASKNRQEREVKINSIIDKYNDQNSNKEEIK